MSLSRVVVAWSAAIGLLAAPIAPSSAVGIDETTSSYLVEVAPSASTAEVTELVETTGGDVTETMTEVIEAVSADLTASEAEALLASPEVEAIYEHQPIALTDTQTDAPWGLSRLDQQSVPVDTSYTYPSSAGRGVPVYIVDTGVSPNPGQYQSRLLSGRNFAPDRAIGPETADCQGHGSHVAGTVGSTTFGVAKSATIVPVRVFTCAKESTTDVLLAALNWIATQPVGVVNLSLSVTSGVFPPLDAAVTSLVNAGYVVAAAAGNNSGLNACNYSPGSAPAALTVGATTSTDSRATYSNIGPCVDLFAPGSDIRSLAFNNVSESAVLSGTSMATPHVAGLAALTLAAYPSYSGAQVANQLVSQAVPNVVTNPGTGSPNRLASATWLNDPYGVPSSIVARDGSGSLWLYPVTAGRFGERLSMGAGWSTYTLLTGAGDLTGDGPRDLISMGPGSTVSLHRGASNGTFSAPESIAGNWSGTTALFSPGDFTGDGHNDLISRSAVGNLFVHANDGTGSFAAPRQVGNGWGGLNSLFGAGDFTGDGFADVMARDAAGRLMLYSGNGRGGWLGGTAIGTGWGGFTSIFSPGDFDGDGATDVLGRLSNGDLYLYSGNGRGSWKGARQVGWGWNAFTSVSGFGGGVSYPFMQSAGAGDLNRDGARDVVTTTGSGEVFRYLGNGSGSWLGGSRVAGLSFTNNRLIAGVGDINFSGTDDLIAVSTSGDLLHYDGNGAGGYSVGTVVGTGWGTMTSVFVVGDANGDRTFDLVARDAAGVAWLYPGTGPLAWGAPTQIATGWQTYTALFPVGDFTGDKKPDIVARSASGLLFVIAGAGNGAWNPPVQIGNGWQSMTSLHGPGDFDGDGRADVIARDATGNLILYSGNGKGSWLGGRVIGWGWQGFTWIG